MKIFEIKDGVCFSDLTFASKFHDLSKINGLEYIEAPDYVFQGWGYDKYADGDNRFIRPESPEGWEYDDATGTFFSLEMMQEKEISELKQKLADTDYQAIKYAEGWLTEEEYAPIKAQRQEWRDAINALESREEVSGK